MDYLYEKAKKEGLERTDTQTLKVMATAELSKAEVDALTDEAFAKYLYKEEKKALELSSANERKMVTKGIPLNVIDFIWANFLAGADPETEIRTALKKEYGDKGSQWLDNFVSIIENEVTIEDII